MFKFSLECQHLWIRHWGIVLIWLAAGVAQGEPLLELTTPSGSWQGRNLFHNEEICWLETPRGEQLQIVLEHVTDYRQVRDQFQPISALDLAAELRRELGRKYEVVTLGKFVVAAPPGRAQLHAAELDGVYRTTRTFFSRRGFELYEPAFPLVAVVYPDQPMFLNAAVQLGVAGTGELRGCYDPRSNRMILYDEVGPGGGLSTLIRDTLVHEGIHQIGFNIGLTNRLASLPTWVIEGLALALEGEHGRTGSGQRGTRANPSRLARFRELSARQGQYSLGEFVADDQLLFSSEPLDAYAISWAVSFYLLETRSAEFTKYLRHLQARPPLMSYEPADRLADFQLYFGTDVSRLQVELQRFSQRLP